MSRQRSHTNRNDREYPRASDPLDDLYDYGRTPAADLYDYTAPLPRRPKRERKRPPNDDLSDWTVTDDWPEHIPVTDAEVDLFERWFGDLFDELFGPRL